MARNVSAEALAAHPLLLLAGPPQQKRRNLVFVRCGADSLHRSLYPLPDERSWDCALSCWEPPREDDVAQVEFVFTGGVSKWDAFVQARFDRPELGFEQYERVFVIDDDVAMKVADIDRVFDIARAHDLSICQPALTPHSFASWEVLRHHPASFLRLTNYVESMMPCFTAEAIALLEEDMRFAVSGWGFDLIFQKVMGPQRKMGVIDAVPVTHTRPVDPDGGRFYVYLRSIGVDPQEELAWFLARHGVTNFGAMALGGIPLVQWIYPDGPKSGQ